MGRINKGSINNPDVPLTKEQLNDYFKKLDANGDGFLSRNELKLAFDSWGAWLPGLGMRTRGANRGLNHADANGDGRLDPVEFEGLVRFALQGGYKVK